MTIFFYKGLSRNPENGNTPVWVLPNIWRLEWVRDTIFGRNASNKILLNAITISELLREKKQGKGVGWGGKISPPPHPD